MTKCIKCKSKIEKTEVEGLAKNEILIKSSCVKCGYFGFSKKEK